MYNLTGSRIPQEVRNDTKGSGNAVELCQHTVERFLWYSGGVFAKTKELDGEELVEKLASIEYEYDAENVISSYKEFPAMMGRN